MQTGAILAFSNVIAAGLGWLAHHFSIRKLETDTSIMANKFESILKDVGKGLLFIFTNKTVETVETGSLNLAAVIWPGLAPLFGRLAAAVANAQAQALVSTAGMSAEQIVAMVITDAQADLQTAGITETAQQTAIVEAAIQFIDSLPSGSVNAAVVAAAVKTAASNAAAGVSQGVTETAAAPSPNAPPAPIEIAAAAKPLAPA